MAGPHVSVTFVGDAGSVSRAARQTAADLRLVSQAAGRESAKVQKAYGGLSRSIKGSLAQFGPALGGALLASQVKSAIDQASGLAEATSKTRVVFQGSARDVEKWGATSARAMGLSKRAALENVSTLGNLFSAMKIGQGEAVAMSKKIVELAADLASFNNVGTEDALLALRSGLVGETEPLRRFGVNLSAARVQAEALASGLVKPKQELQASHKAMAAYEIILKDTRLAQGDFARTADGLANKQRILAAEFENVKARIGAGLVPVMQAAIGVTLGLIDIIEAVPGPAKAAAAALVAIKVARAPLLSLAATIGESVRGLRLASHLAGGYRAALFAAVRGAITPANIALGAGIGILSVWAKRKEDARRRTDEFVDALKREADGMKGASLELAINNLRADGSLERARKLGIGFDVLTRAVNGNGEAYKFVMERLKEYDNAGAHASGETAQLGVDARRLSGAVRSQTSALRDARKETVLADEALSTFGGTTEDVAAKVVQFAGMTSEEFAKWRASTVDAINPLPDALKDMASESRSAMNDLADGTKRPKDALRTLGDRAKVTAREILDSFLKQAEDLANYRANWEAFLARNPSESLVKQLQEMGTDGASLVAGLAQSNDREFAKINKTWLAAEGNAKRTADAVNAHLKKIARDREVRVRVVLDDVNDARDSRGGGAVRRHSGGRVPGRPDQDVPAVLKGGEHVLENDRHLAEIVRNAGGAGPTVNITVNATGRADDARALSRQIAVEVGRQLDLMRRAG